MVVTLGWGEVLCCLVGIGGSLYCHDISMLLFLLAANMAALLVQGGMIKLFSKLSGSPPGFLTKKG